MIRCVLNVLAKGNGIGAMLERLMRADCKSVGYNLRWFESGSSQIGGLIYLESGQQELNLHFLLGRQEHCHYTIPAAY